MYCRRYGFDSMKKAWNGKVLKSVVSIVIVLFIIG
jgi:hypothetical protein